MFFSGFTYYGTFIQSKGPQQCMFKESFNKKLPLEVQFCHHAQEFFDRNVDGHVGYFKDQVCEL